MKRNASAVWNGGLDDGFGWITSDSGVLSDTPYSSSTRFEAACGTNPEELLAAAHAGCFSMDLSSRLGHAHLIPDSIETTASLMVEKSVAGFKITGIHLDVVARIPGADIETFNAAVTQAKEGCPISRVLSAPVTVSARLDALSQIDA